MYLEDKYGKTKKDKSSNIESKLNSANGKRHLKVTKHIFKVHFPVIVNLVIDLGCLGHSVTFVRRRCDHRRCRELCSH